MKNKLFVIFSLVLLSACGGQNNKSVNGSKDSLTIKKREIAKPISALEKKYIAAGLINIHQLDTSIKVNLKYATTDNFIKCNVYGNLDKAYFQNEVAEKLVNAQKYLKEKNKNFSLIIFDATRPLSVQKKMWDILKMQPSEKIKYLSDPKTGGLHNYGLAVDISILDEKGKELDMGTPFDFMGKLASPQCETKMLSAGKLTQQQIDNRKLLRSVMNKAGFYAIPYEWWHFNLCTIQTAKSKYKVIE